MKVQERRQKTQKMRAKNLNRYLENLQQIPISFPLLLPPFLVVPTGTHTHTTRCRLQNPYALPTPSRLLMGDCHQHSNESLKNHLPKAKLSLSSFVSFVPGVWNGRNGMFGALFFFSFLPGYLVITHDSPLYKRG